MNISLKYEPLLSSRKHEHYKFINNEHCATVVSALHHLPIELVVYHDRKEFAIYHIYDDDMEIMDEIFECIYDNLEFLDADEYELQEVTNGNVYYVRYVQRKYGVDYENYR